MLLLLAWPLTTGCRPEDDAAETAPSRPEPDDGASLPRAAAPELFAEASPGIGLDFVHFNGMTGEYYYNELLGAGSALLDYDHDGDLDVYFVQGHLLGPKTLEQALFPPDRPLPLTDRLFRNDLTVKADGSRELRFHDVTEEAGLRAFGYGMGAFTGDYDNDGWVDLYVTNWGPNQLWHNNGDGTFREVGGPAGVDEPRWSVAAAFADFDRDGWLDLYVSNYVDFTLAVHKECTTDLGLRDYCGPVSFDPVPDALFRNRGDGTFEEVLGSGIETEYGSALGVVTADFDGDGWIDVYVANDGLPNQMWINQGDWTFRNQALLGGTAVNEMGQAQASMGVDAGDVDNDGDEDLVMAHLNRETNTFYRNDGHGVFRDTSSASGLGPPSWDFTGFGAGFFDYDNDGWLDLFVANGAVNIIRSLLLAGDPYPLHQRNLLFHNRGDGSFEDATPGLEPAFQRSEVSRGVTFGDIDNDGDTDVLVSNNSGPARLLLNGVGQRQRWIGLVVLTGPGPRPALGARVAIHTATGATLWRRVRTDGSYVAGHDPRILVGLGEAGAVERVDVHWLEGGVESWTDLPLGEYSTLRQGTGSPVSGAP